MDREERIRAERWALAKEAVFWLAVLAATLLVVFFIWKGTPL